MAEKIPLNNEHLVPYETDLRCPVCEAPLEMLAVVSIKKGASRHVGTKGMTKIVSVSFESEVRGFQINHSCDCTPPKEN